MNNKSILVLVLVLGVALATFGCVGTPSTPATGFAADGDFMSLNVRNGPTTLTGPVLITGSVNITGNMTSNSINVTSPAANIAFSGNNNFTGNNAFTGNNTHAGAETFSGLVNLTAATVSAPNVVEAGTGTFVNNTATATFTFATPFISTPVVDISKYKNTSDTFFISAITTKNVTIGTTSGVTDGNVSFGYVAVGAQ